MLNIKDLFRGMGRICIELGLRKEIDINKVGEIREFILE